MVHNVGDNTKFKKQTNFCFLSLCQFLQISRQGIPEYGYGNKLLLALSVTVIIMVIIAIICLIEVSQNACFSSLISECKMVIYQSIQLLCPSELKWKVNDSKRPDILLLLDGQLSHWLSILTSFILYLRACARDSLFGL